MTSESHSIKKCLYIHSVCTSPAGNGNRCSVVACSGVSRAHGRVHGCGLGHGQRGVNTRCSSIIVTKFRAQLI